MTTQIKLNGDWNELKQKLSAYFPQLEEKDLSFSRGKEKELLSRIGKKLHVSEEAIVALILKMRMNLPDAVIAND